MAACNDYYANTILANKVYALNNNSVYFFITRLSLLYFDNM